jgi:DnaJ-class molecular chaperone
MAGVHFRLLAFSFSQSSFEAIRDSYKKLSLSHHPDKVRKAAPTHTPTSQRKAEKMKQDAQRMWAKIEHVSGEENKRTERDGISALILN